MSSIAFPVGCIRVRNRQSYKFSHPTVDHSQLWPYQQYNGVDEPRRFKVVLPSCITFGVATVVIKRRNLVEMKMWVVAGRALSRYLCTQPCRLRMGRPRIQWHIGLTYLFCFTGPYPNIHRLRVSKPAFPKSAWNECVIPNLSCAFMFRSQFSSTPTYQSIFELFLEAGYSSVSRLGRIGKAGLSLQWSRAVKFAKKIR